MADGTITIDVELNEKAFKASLENMGETVKTNADLMIKSVEGVSGSFVYDNGAPPRITEQLTARFTEKSIVVLKKTKRGMSDIDIAPFIRDLEFSEGDGITMTGKISAQNPSLNPENLIAALTGGHSGMKPDFAVFTRTEVFDEEMGIFR